MRRILLAMLLLLPLLARTAAPDERVIFPTSAAQGSMVIGKVMPGSDVHYRGRTLRVTAYGTVAFGVGRDENGPLSITVKRPDGSVASIEIAVSPRDWPIERVNGLPPKTVDPPPEIAARITREQAAVAAVRERDDDRTDFTETFIRPVDGRISGRFGNQRVYNGKPGSGHSGMDIAASRGTPVKAPASGMVSFANADLYLTGGTIVIDHGFGFSSNFLHLSRLDVKVGDRVAQGQIIGAVGASGRASGPHLHWGMNWFDVRIDPQLVLDAAH
jgi:murein DD-endopeptidase MepM/ murein hydrolase activator NlpD